MCSRPHMQQLGPEQGTAVHQHNAQGRGRRGVSLPGSHQSACSSFEWCSSQCRPPGSAKNVSPGTGMFLVANDGRGL